MGKTELIKSIKQYSDDYVGGDSFKSDKWGEICELGNVIHTLLIG